MYIHMSILRSTAFNCLTLLWLIIPLQLSQAQTVTGLITDSQTGEPLPSATVLLEGTYRGTIANLEGEFTIEADHYPVTLLVRYIGYESRRIVVEHPVEKPVEVEMVRSITELNEIVVTGDDPGLSIMERVIERKKLWRRDLETYSVEAFTRQVLRNDSTIVSITESGTRSYWDHQKGHREVQLYRNQTANIAEDQNLAGVRFLPNFYDDNVEVAGYDMVGITHPDALDYYDFSLVETRQMDGEPVYVIEVTPKRRLQPLFEGTAFVLGSDYALLEVNLKPNSVVRFPPPVREFDLTYHQQFSNYNSVYWLPVDMRIRGTVRIEMTGLRFPAIRFSQTSRLSDYRVNRELPDSLFENAQVFNQSGAQTDSLTSDSARLIPLTEEEVTAYERIDSTGTLDKAFEPEGFLAGLVRDDEEGDTGGIGRSYIPNNLFPVGAFNRVEGFRAGLRYTPYFEAAGLEAELAGSYSFHAKRYNVHAKARQRYYRTESGARFYLEGEYYNRIQEQSSGSLFIPLLNSLQTLAGGVDYFDYYEQEGWTGGFVVENLVPKTDLSVHFQQEKAKSAALQEANVMNYSLFGWHKDRSENPGITEGVIRSLKLRADVNRQKTNYGISGNRQLRVGAELVPDIFGSDVSFTRLYLEGSWNLNTFFKRRIFANTLDLHFTAGILSGDDTPQRYGVVDGSMNRFAPFGTLKTQRNRPYRGKEYWSVSAEHNFRTVPFELMGLQSLVNRGWSVILFGGAGYAGGVDHPGVYSDAGSNGIHSEAGVSLNSILGVLRIDAAKRIDRPGFYFGLSVPRYF